MRGSSRPGRSSTWRATWRSGLQKQVDAGQMTKEAAIAEFSKRGNTLTFDKGNGYVFAYTMDGIAVLAPVPEQIGQNRMDVDTGGRKLVRELRDGIARPTAKSCCAMNTASPARKS